MYEKGDSKIFLQISCRVLLFMLEATQKWKFVTFLSIDSQKKRCVFGPIDLFSFPSTGILQTNLYVHFMYIRLITFPRSMFDC